MRFLRDNLGIPRVAMPQLSGVPTPDSRAFGLPRDPYFNGVDLGPRFWEALQVRDIEMTHYKELTIRLKPTQNELNCAKVDELTELILAGRLKDQCLFISSDLFIVDGHHRWAADLQAGLKSKLALRRRRLLVSRADIPISQILDLARAFEKFWGPWQ